LKFFIIFYTTEITDLLKQMTVSIVRV